MASDPVEVIRRLHELYEDAGRPSPSAWANDVGVLLAEIDRLRKIEEAAEWLHDQFVGLDQEVLDAMPSQIVNQASLLSSRLLDQNERSTG